MSKWTYPFPVWVSRENADGNVSQFTMPLWLAIVLFFLLALNVAAWSVIGLIEAVQYAL